jgi:hypothetical protein
VCRKMKEHDTIMHKQETLRRQFDKGDSLISMEALEYILYSIIKLDFILFLIQDRYFLKIHKTTILLNA